MDSREQFEKWAKGNSLALCTTSGCVNTEPGHYDNSFTFVAWSAWQASRDAAIEECETWLRARAEWYGYGTGPRNAIAGAAEDILALKGKG